MSERHVGFEEFVTRGRAPERARALHGALERLADGSAGDVLQEMAREVLTGRVGLRDAVRVGAYAEALGEGTRALRAAWQALPEQERARYAEEARRTLAARGGDGDTPSSH
ncbi:HMG-box domain-containing protein [Streptomyces klenkii]|uniref:HMG-box domain-containing protein n=1 Tax=Streptomyces klenkii TaxID=1420899 RepID=UPI00339F5EC4